MSLIQLLSLQRIHDSFPVAARQAAANQLNKFKAPPGAALYHF
jgi:hypothetical protein